MTDLAKRGPLGLKKPKEKTPRKPMRQVSKKRAAYHASPEGKAALEHMARVKALPCVICKAPPPNDAHHCFHGRYGARKESHFDVIPLCKACHQNGPLAIHNGKESWAARNGPDYSYLPLVAAMLNEPHEIEF